jgi:P22_AR N-terminal domain
MGAFRTPIQEVPAVTQMLQAQRYRSAVLAIPYFNVAVRTVAVSRTVYFPVRAVCMVLGVNHRTQRARLQTDSRFNSPALRDLPVMTSQGYRDTLCIRKDKVGAWLALIDPPHCKLAKTRELLEKFQAELFAAADRFLFGDTSDVVYDEATKTAAPIVGTLSVGSCPHCGLALRIAYTDSGAHLEPDE